MPVSGFSNTVPLPRRGVGTGYNRATREEVTTHLTFSVVRVVERESLRTLCPFWKSARCTVGREAIFSPWLAVGPKPWSQYVDIDRTGNRGGRPVVVGGECMMTAADLRADRGHAGAPARACDDAKHQTKPVSCVRLKQHWRADRGWFAVSVCRYAALARHSRCRNEFVIGLGGLQLVASAAGAPDGLSQWRSALAGSTCQVEAFFSDSLNAASCSGVAFSWYFDLYSS